MNLDLRPLTVGEVFDRAITLYKRNLWLFVGITAIPAVFALAMTIISQILQRLMMTNMTTLANDPDVAATKIVAMRGMVGSIFVIGVIYWIVYMIGLGATTYAVSELYVGRSASV